METVCENQGEIFYEARDRLHSKGKGKGKKGKGKGEGGSRTYGLGAPALDEEEDIWSTERCRRRLATAVDLIDRGNNAKGQDFL